MEEVILLLLVYKGAFINPFSANFTKWSNTLKQFVNLPTNCLSVFDHFVGLVLKGLASKKLLCSVEMQFQMHYFKDAYN